MKTFTIEENKDATVGLCLDTLKMSKQALVFCSSKRGAESQAEKVAKAVIKKKGNSNKSILNNLSDQVEGVLSKPTKQCKRLAECIREGIAFHHAGLAGKQRELIEDNFRNGNISIICSTPTLAAGLDMPAFRSIVRDTKRYTDRGMMPIPVLEYEQMSGRAGRPGQEDYGEAIIVAANQSDLEYYIKNYIHGEVEEIHSKLSVEPVLRTYVLSLIGQEEIRNTAELYEFFDGTFHAFQFGDFDALHGKLDMTIEQLKTWGFLEGEPCFDNTVEENNSGFVSAVKFLKKNKKSVNLKATSIGRRVSEIYIDPLTAHLLIDNLSKLVVENINSNNDEQVMQVVHLLCCTLEIRPLIRMKNSEYTNLTQEFVPFQDLVLVSEDDFSKVSVDDYMGTVKTSLFMRDWINEMTEEKLLEKYGIRPGEISGKLNNADWLIYACSELARMKSFHNILKLLNNVRIRLKEGVKGELLALLNFKGVGRVRARLLYDNDVKSAGDVKKIDPEILARMIGTRLSIALKEQVGVTIDKEDEEKMIESRKVENKRLKLKKNKGQSTLGDF